MTITVQQVLDTYADGLDEAEFAAALAADLERRATDRAVVLSAAEREVLLAAGVDAADLAPADDIGELARHSADLLIDAAASSMSAAEAAVGLGISASRVRHRVSDRSLYAFRLGTTLRLPEWQFSRPQPGALTPLPHLRRVVAAAPQAIAPVELARFMTMVQPTLDPGDGPTSPRAWLLAGGDADAVCELLADLYQW